MVVPCFNEEVILPYLENTLRSVERAILDRYDVGFVFVDDGSSDATLPTLMGMLGARRNRVHVRHNTDRGVAVAIMTGITAATAEVVCSLDCDCTYDPHQIERLISMLTKETDMVTASPYHTGGVVKNVPSWKLFLSRSLPSLYRRILHHSVATPTSCFRVHRRSAMTGIRLSEGGFLGVAEVLGRLGLRGGRIVECPAVLEVRLSGRSKMKILKTVVGHLRLSLRSGLERFKASPAYASRAPRLEGRAEPEAVERLDTGESGGDR